MWPHAAPLRWRLTPSDTPGVLTVPCEDVDLLLRKASKADAAGRRAAKGKGGAGASSTARFLVSMGMPSMGSFPAAQDKAEFTVRAVGWGIRRVGGWVAVGGRGCGGCHGCSGWVAVGGWVVPLGR